VRACIEPLVAQFDFAKTTGDTKLQRSRHDAVDQFHQPCKHVLFVTLIPLKRRFFANRFSGPQHADIVAGAFLNDGHEP
tara:strand:+ start:549 stop:785 length:237 start_codon:yes stop_codon:yes gene_type:complete